MTLISVQSISILEFFSFPLQLCRLLLRACCYPAPSSNGFVRVNLGFQRTDDNVLQKGDSRKIVNFSTDILHLGYVAGSPTVKVD